ncbi:Protein O-Mannosyl-Transferase Tmtc2 [Manis pentadactyla]|nr:Protein O-Mannosyl-Transferase Tmtc2 [Manis pentadactyla]
MSRGRTEDARRPMIDEPLKSNSSSHKSSSTPAQSQALYGGPQESGLSQYGDPPRAPVSRSPVAAQVTLGPPSFLSSPSLRPLTQTCIPSHAASSHWAECEHQGNSLPHCHTIQGSSDRRAL